MQVQKPKQGYKLVKWHFGKYEEIPEDWENKKIDDMVKFEGGSQPPRIDFIFEPKEGYVRMIQIRDFKTEHYATYISKKYARKFFEKDDVMIGRYGPPNFQILRGLSGAYNVALIKAIPKNGLEKDYLYYFLKQDKFFHLMDSLGQRTAGQDGIELDILKKLPFPIPSKNERKKIVSILSNVDSLIQQVQNQINLTQKLKDGIMQKLLTKGIGHNKFKKITWLFDKDIEIPDSWNIVKLNDIALKVIDMNHQMPEKLSSGVPFITTGYLSANSNLNLEIKDNAPEIQYVSKSDFEIESRKFNPESGDILFSRYGTIGIAKFIHTHQKFLASYSIALIKLKKNLIDGLFLTYFLNSKNVKNQIAFLREQSSNNNLHLSKINHIKIMLPDLTEQRKIVGFLSNVDSQILRLKSKITNLENLKNGLMQKLLTGQIRVKV